MNYSKTQYTHTTYIVDMDQISKKSLNDFDDTFNMVFDIRNKNFNWFDNPYISPNVYEVDHNNEPKLSKNIKLKKCDDADKLKFMS